MSEPLTTLPIARKKRPKVAAFGIDLVPHEAKPLKVRAALSNSFGFGGTNATLVFTHPDTI